MNYEELMSIKVIPKDIAKSQSKSLVNNLYHTPYKDEIRLFSCIKQGNLKKLIFEMTQLGIQNITVGQMSDDELKQQKYMAVSFITLATRYAIQGGMNENNAYSFSDSFILKIDKAKNKAAVNLKDMTVIIYAICSAFQANLIIFRFLKRSMALLRVNLLHLQGKKGLLKN